MTSVTLLQGLLPAPKKTYSIQHDEDDVANSLNLPIEAPQKRVNIPPYGFRKSYIPIAPEDFGDGGAFPEIHVVQYPRNMGKPGAKSSAVVAVDVDEKGAIRFDSIVKYGANRDKLVRSTLDDMKVKQGDKDTLALPEEKEEVETAEKTRAALEAILEGKIKSSKPASAVHANEAVEPTYIRYTPDPNAPGYNAAAKQRVIKMVEAQVDPMEPPKHKHTKVPRGPPSPPVPVLHSPPRKLTVEDRQSWKIPPCISNWKNARGYTIPLDKRLAADGRGLQEVTINNKFAMISEALYVAERKAAEDLRIRNQIRKKMAMKEKEDREKELRDMALRARMERAGVLGSGDGEDEGEEEGKGSLDTQPSNGGRLRERSAGAGAGGLRRDALDSGSDDDRGSRGRYHDEERNRGREKGAGRGAVRDDRGNGDRSEGEADDDDDDLDEREMRGLTPEERVALQQRERLRIERRKERERELRLENMKGNMRKNKVDRDEGRDISERIALGMLKSTGKLTGEAMYDSRLFNQSAGMDSGFGGDDEYNTYSKPLFERSEASSIYRPKRDDADIYGDADAQFSKLSDTSRFKPDKGFKGAESSGRGGARDAPVQFEKAREEEEDPFGIGDIVGSKAKKARHD